MPRYLGGSFAPPLTDEKLEGYRRLLFELPPSPEKDGIAYVAPSPEKWWELPEAQGTERGRHPFGMEIIRLQEDHQAILDELIPWEHELKALGGTREPGLFHRIEAGAVERNSPKLQDWTLRVYEHLTARHFPEDPETYARIWEAAGKKDSWWNFVSEAERQRFLELLPKAQQCCREIAQTVSSKFHPDIPRPVLEPTRVRDMAFHLLWHSREFDLGREPLTIDKL